MLWPIPAAGNLFTIFCQLSNWNNLINFCDLLGDVADPVGALPLKSRVWLCSVLEQCCSPGQDIHRLKFHPSP
jgi:hypothetical protein